MKQLLSSLLAFVPLFSLAQRSVDVEKSSVSNSTLFVVGGEPFVNEKFVRLVSGTPYFSKEWMPATGRDANGRTYRSRAIRLDLVDNRVIFLDSTGAEMIATTPLLELTLADTLTGSTYHFVNRVTPELPHKGWYLLKAEGAATLYQYFLKLLSERQPYGSATTEQTLATMSEFYLVRNGQVYPVKKAKELLPLLADRGNGPEALLKTSTVRSLPAAEQMTVLVNYYNSLPPAAAR